MVNARYDARHGWAPYKLRIENTAGRAPGPAPQSAALDEASRQRLAALGYLGRSGDVSGPGFDRDKEDPKDLIGRTLSTPVVSGVLSLHNFPKTPSRTKPFNVHRDSSTGKLVPDLSEPRVRRELRSVIAAQLALDADEARRSISSRK